MSGIKAEVDRTRSSRWPTSWPALKLNPARNGKGAEAAGLAPISPNGAATQFILLGEQSEDEGLAEKLKAAFKVVQASYSLRVGGQADVVLPAPIWAEQTGHVTNLEGKVFPLNRGAGYAGYGEGRS